ncbi:MAG: hypothetical protein KatS3mg111_1098 [Pirellulaceae bacterium]|nr:MAG: hypothetical protein KatS3mg111_1098 [Pirellulaceae bacterium]
MFIDQPNLQIAIALLTVLGVFLVMATRRNAPTEVLFVGALTWLVIAGVIKPERAWQSLSDPAVIAIGGLLIVSAALRTSGVLDAMSRWLLGTLRTEREALGRLALVVITSSAFLLNTAIVAMLMPLLIQWCRSRQVSPSKLLLPVSYFAILGGTCTLVGTSTNLVVNGTLRDVFSEMEVTLASAGPAEKGAGSAESGSMDQGAATGKQDWRNHRAWMRRHAAELRPMSMTDISWIGVPGAIVGAIWLVWIGRRLMPDRRELLDSLGERRREYLVEMLVTENCQLVGKTVEQGGLRHLPGLFLIEIDRGGEVITPVAPSDRIYANDRLVFTGVVSTIVDLEKIQGLVSGCRPSVRFAGGRRTGENARRSGTQSFVTTGRDDDSRRELPPALWGRRGCRAPQWRAFCPRRIGDIELAPGDTPAAADAIRFRPCVSQ